MAHHVSIVVTLAGGEQIVLATEQLPSMEAAFERVSSILENGCMGMPHRDKIAVFSIQLINAEQSIGIIPDVILEALAKRQRRRTH